MDIDLKRQELMRFKQFASSEIEVEKTASAQALPQSRERGA